LLFLKTVTHFKALFKLKIVNKTITNQSKAFERSLNILNKDKQSTRFVVQYV